MVLITDILHDAVTERSWWASPLLGGAILYLFACLYTVSDRHLTVALRNIAKTLHLPADLAGMTLLAFGNGAPDFFTAIFGASQAPEMILSGAVGAALFTFTIVYGLVIIWQQPEVMQSLPSEAEQPESPIQAVPTPLLTRPATVDRVPFFRNLLLCLFCISCLITLLRIEVIRFWMPLVLLCVYLVNLSISIIGHVVGQRSQMVAVRPSPITASPLEKDPSLDQHAFWASTAIEKIHFLIRTSMGGASQRGLFYRFFRRGGVLVKLPMTLIANFTLLPVRYPERGDVTDDKRLCFLIINRIRLLTAPFGTLALFGLLLGIRNWVIWLVLGAVAPALGSLLWFKCSSWTGPPADSLLLLQSIITFTTCLGFIYLISAELISCLRTFGHLMGISLSTMGILVLAWGNSFGDLVADTRMSRSGFLNMAMFGVFAAHIQNVLFTLGTSFLLATLTSGGTITVGTIDFKVFIGVSIVIVVLLSSLLLVPTLFRFHLPKPYGFTLLSFYGVFAATAFVLELTARKT